MLALADLYDKGLGVLQDFGQASEYLEMAAGNNDIDTQVVLGKRYSNEESLFQDFVRLTCGSM